jgi:hypothetical protein
MRINGTPDKNIAVIMKILIIIKYKYYNGKILLDWLTYQDYSLSRLITTNLVDYNI